MSPDRKPSQKTPWPAYFIVRTTGEVVPLIAVDELPKGIDLVGVSRSFDLEDTIGMLNLGVERSSGAFYQTIQSLDSNSALPSAARKSRAPDLCNQQKTQQVSLETSPQLNDAEISTRKLTLQTSGREHGQQQTCRHWCTHGICKWGQSCRFRHVMPMTLHGLQGIGLDDWPAWYRKVNPGYFAGEATRNVIAGKGEKGGRERFKGKALLEQGKRQELVEQTMARLRSMPKELRPIPKRRLQIEEEISESAKIERATLRDVRSWEEESSEEDGNTEKEQLSGDQELSKDIKRMLVDI